MPTGEISQFLLVAAIKNIACCLLLRYILFGIDL
jgi:hypothetical protein